MFSRKSRVFFKSRGIKSTYYSLSFVLLLYGIVIKKHRLVSRKAIACEPHMRRALPQSSTQTTNDTRVLLQGRIIIPLNGQQQFRSKTHPLKPRLMLSHVRSSVIFNVFLPPLVRAALMKRISIPLGAPPPPLWFLFGRDFSLGVVWWCTWRRFLSGYTACGGSSSSTTTRCGTQSAWFLFSFLDL